MRTSRNGPKPRWEDYVIAFEGTFNPPESLWASAAESAEGLRSMYLLGVGFDPRALVGLQKFLALAHSKPPIIGLIELPPPSEASSYLSITLAQDNRATFEDMVANLEVRTVPHQPVHSKGNAGPRVSRLVTSPMFVKDIGHMIIDVSSLPSHIFFSVIAAALESVEREVTGFPKQIQVTACENPEIDAAIREMEITDASVVGGFRGEFAYDSHPSRTVIWAPVIGEHASHALSSIHSFLRPDDVYPVLPFPSRDPRRADALLLEYQVELLDQFQVDPGNIIYADERNPFDLYRTLSRLQAKLDLAFYGLDSMTLAVSTHSSKLLSVGVLLAAYENKLPVVAAPPVEYEIVDIDFEGLTTTHQVTSTWLAGMPYASE